MVLIEDDKYKETLKILRNRKELPPIFQEMKRWLKKRYSINAYNFIFERIKYNNPESTYQLHILLSNTKDYRSMMDKNCMRYDEKKQEMISRKFYELALTYSYSDEKKAKDVWVCYNDFSVEIKTDVNVKTHKKINDNFMKKYRKYSIWNFYTSFESVVVFFYKNSDIIKNTKNQVCELMKNDYFTELKKNDEFNVYKEDEFMMEYDSKENLDKNYSGNLYYYFK